MIARLAATLVVTLLATLLLARCFKAGALRPVCVLGTAWATIDDDSTAGKSTVGAGLGVVSNGALLQLGSKANDWRIRRSADGGVSWTDVDTLSVASGAFGFTESNGTVFAAGQNGKALIRRSTDGGVTWSNADNPTDPSDTTGMASHPTGAVIWAGYLGSPSRYAARRTTDGGNSWTTVDDFNAGNSAGNHVARAAATGPDGKLYTAGWTMPAATPTLTTWTVRASADAGVTWASIDSDAPSGSSANAAQAVNVSPEGTIFVGGTRNVSGANQWVVRGSTDGGTKWMTVEAFQLSSGKAASPVTIVFDADHHIHVLGSAHDSSDVPHWIVRSSADGGSTWATTDDFQLATGHAAFGHTIRRDARGNLYAIGPAKDSADLLHSVVRKLSCQ